MEISKLYLIYATLLHHHAKLFFKGSLIQDKPKVDEGLRQKVINCCYSMFNDIPETTEVISDILDHRYCIMISQTTEVIL